MKDELTYEKYLKAISFDELIKAANECSKGVKWKESTAKFYNDRLFRISQLRKLLLDESTIIGSYTILDYIRFKTYDPKPREISATRIRDRILLRSLCNNGLYDAFVKPFIYDNLACLKGKGITKAILRMKFHLSNYAKENSTNKGYYIKLDIKHYFLSTPHEELKKIVSYYIKEPHFKTHVFKIIDSFEDNRSKKEISNDKFGKRGIGLGSQLSQLLQLLYLNDLDHYIKEQLKVKHYLRYMDDMILLAQCKLLAKDLLGKIKTVVEKKGLELNRKSKIGKIENNIQFCKVIYKIGVNGKVKTKIVRKTLNREVRRLKKYKELLSNSAISIKDLILHGNTWFGFAKWRCSGKLLAFIKKTISKLFNGVNNIKELNYANNLKRKN